MKRNVAIELSAGEIIAHFDDDDLYAEGYLTWMSAPRRMRMARMAPRGLVSHLLVVKDVQENRDRTWKSVGLLDQCLQGPLGSEHKKRKMIEHAYIYIYLYLYLCKSLQLCFPEARSMCRAICKLPHVHLRCPCWFAARYFLALIDINSSVPCSALLLCFPATAEINATLRVVDIPTAMLSLRDLCLC